MKSTKSNRKFMILTPVKGGKGFAKAEKVDKGFKWSIQVEGIDKKEVEIFLLSKEGEAPFSLGIVTVKNGQGSLMERTPIDADAVVVGDGEQIILYSQAFDWDVQGAFLHTVKNLNQPKVNEPEQVKKIQPKPSKEVKITPSFKSPVVEEKKAVEIIKNIPKHEIEQIDMVHRIAPYTVKEIQKSAPTTDVAVNANAKETVTASGDKRFPPSPQKLQAKWWMIREMKFEADKLGIPTLSDGSHWHPEARKIMTEIANSLTETAVYHHGYYLLGISQNGLYYAIPSFYAIDPPALLFFGNKANWFPAKGFGYEDGAMGYWVIKIDLKNGEIFA